ncbi:MAG: PLP-dependent transferase, partial [Bacteroidales bacterium]|nr:PLP-dependent transferase [Bacteroidales bacterium]
MRKVNSLKTPIYRDDGFHLKDAASVGEAFQSEMLHNRKPETYIYSRYRNPTVVSVEEQIMELEKSK